MHFGTPLTEGAFVSYNQNHKTNLTMKIFRLKQQGKKIVALSDTYTKYHDFGKPDIK